ncbi:MAG TPA: AAA family ATPase [Polyangiaceae bacterium]|nr:AAA family ATPase [Polyangiaceae bacterium]
MTARPVAAAGVNSRIIFLNGASSAGKSTLARAVQAALEDPFERVSSDLLEGGIPKRWGGNDAWWREARPRFFAGFHGCIRALAAAGNDLIVEHVIEFPAWRTELARLLGPFDVYLVGVHCSLDELERRERQRGDRRLGEGREHLECDRIHTFGPYDLDVDTTGRDPSALAAELIRCWRGRTASVLHSVALLGVP